MKRTLITLSAAAAMLATSSATASAQQPASPRSSCVAVITSYEASQLAPGSVGNEVSGLAMSNAGIGTALVSPLAANHLGSLEACREPE